MKFVKKDNGVEISRVVRISRALYVSIPQAFQRAFKIRAGDRLFWKNHGQQITVVKEKARETIK